MWVPESATNAATFSHATAAVDTGPSAWKLVSYDERYCRGKCGPGSVIPPKRGQTDQDSLHLGREQSTQTAGGAADGTGYRPAGNVPGFRLRPLKGEKWNFPGDRWVHHDNVSLRFTLDARPASDGSQWRESRIGSTTFQVPGSLARDQTGDARVGHLAAVTGGWRSKCRRTARPRD